MNETKEMMLHAIPEPPDLGPDATAPPSSWLPKMLWADRALEERENANRRKADLFTRREFTYWSRADVIRSRVAAMSGIRPPGASLKSQRRFREQLRNVLAADPEHVALMVRYERVNDLLHRLRRRRASEEVAAGVMTIDDRATRQRKRREWIERQRTEKEAVDGQNKA